LAYLAVRSGREHSREALASLLWPERPDREALSALRYALSNLRSALGDRGSAGDRRETSPFLLVTRTTVEFNRASDHWLDLAEFEELRLQPDVASLERALSLYRGPFLDGLSLADSPAFEEWALLKVEETRRSVLSVLGHLTTLQMARGETSEAERWARRQLELEPYREQAHRQLMVALALSGERSAALAHYETCRQLLAQDLGCEPEDETLALYAQIRDGTLSHPPSPPASLTAMQWAPSTAAQHGSPATSAYPRVELVARQQELARLGSFLEQALTGQGGVALIEGEAGGGKTALLDEFARWAGQAHGGLIVLSGRCNAYAGAGDPYLPFREMLQTLAGEVEGKRASGTLSPAQARRVWEALPAVGAALVEHGPDLIDSFVPGEALVRRAEAFRTPSGVTQWQARLREIVQRDQQGTAPAPQADLFAQVTHVLHAVAVSRPLLLSIDDLQWADGGTVALLFHLGRRLSGSRILLVCAYRPEALPEPTDPEGPGRPLGSVLQELAREWGDVLIDLDQADGRAFVEAYVDSEPNRLGPAFRQALYDHGGGNPLFTVELLRSFQRQGALLQDEAGRWVEAGELDWERWPPRVEAVIAANVADLPDEDRAILQAASVQGEQFAAEVVAGVLAWDEEAVVRRLSGPLGTRHRLVEAVSLDRLPSSGQRLSRYRFRHWLVQRSAYRSLDAVARARLHEATGRALEAVYAAEERPPALAPALARHFEAAGMPLEAARYRLEAGRWAAHLVAYDEAIAHLERGLALLDGVAPSRERLRLELVLCMAMDTPAMLQRGWQAPAYTRALERLSELIQHPDLRDDPQRLTGLSVLALSMGWSAHPESSSRAGDQLLGLAQEGDQQPHMLGHWALGFSYWLRGQPIAAREHLGRALTLYAPEANGPLSGLLGADPGVMAHAMLGSVLWLLGYPDQARASLQQGVAQARELDQAPSLGFAHFMAAMMTSVLGRDVAVALNHCQALSALGQVNLVYGVWAELLAAQAQAQEGRAGAGTLELELEQGLARAVEAGSTWQAAGSGAGYAGLLLLQAEVCAQAGQIETGQQAMDQALAWIERTGVRAMEADVWRMRGELLLLADRSVSSTDPGDAQSCFLRALQVAREQQARWLELRAAVSLARLWRNQGRRDEARELLADIYGWFSEGFDTPDLIEAKSLLEELA
jgi:DNA-binding SARP family transcriptional activator